MIQLDVVIVGGGISGLSIGSMLKDKGNQAIILEKKTDVGGLIRCTVENNVLFHRVGGHVFNSKDNKVLQWFWSKFNRETEFIKAKRNAKILLGDKLIGYPIEDYLFELSDDQLKPIINDIIFLASQKAKETSAGLNFRDFLLSKFGKNLYDLYFGPYNSKIWKRDLSNIPIEWLDGKLPMPNLSSILMNNIRRLEESTMPHSSFWYPMKGGSQFIVDRLSKNLHVVKNTGLRSIAISGGKLLVNNRYSCSCLVYTGDLRELKYFVKIDDSNLQDLLVRIMELPSNGTSNVLCETDDTDLSWLYLPGEEFLAHRIIYTGNFSPNNNSQTGRKTCVVEFSGTWSEEKMFQDIKKLPGNLTPIAINIEPNSYILHSTDTKGLVDNLKISLAKYNIFLLGRFAEWEYYNMDVCMKRAMEVCEEIDIRI
jgi:protoporphyrinogen oxidase